MPLKKVMKGSAIDPLPASGLMYHDPEALSPCQKECVARLGETIQIEQESYLSKHPEVIALQKIFIAKLTRVLKRKNIQKEAGVHFSRPVEILDEEVRDFLKSPPYGPYVQDNVAVFDYKDESLIKDLEKILLKHYPPKPWEVLGTPEGTINTLSSSFLSFVTSESTLPTPEPVPTPEPTISEIFFTMVSNTVDKAIFLHIDDRILLYDTAYVELMKAVEQAMEIPVLGVREDIALMIYGAFHMFEIYSKEKERIAAEIAWEKRMRKKLKRMVRRQKNFRGYETPPTPKSTISSHESYKKPPPDYCKCNPQFTYNRYEKDRFGIYLPNEAKFSGRNVTATPVISLEDLLEDEGKSTGGNADTKSIASKKEAGSEKADKKVTLPD